MATPVRLKRRGKGLGPRIPNGAAEASGFKVDDVVGIGVMPDGMTVGKSRRRYNLGELLSRVTPKNKHGAVDWGGLQGRELL